MPHDTDPRSHGPAGAPWGSFAWSPGQARASVGRGFGRMARGASWPQRVAIGLVALVSIGLIAVLAVVGLVVGSAVALVAAAAAGVRRLSGARPARRDAGRRNVRVIVREE